MALKLEDKLEWLRKFKGDYPHVLQRPFSSCWRPEDVSADGYVPIREHGIKYYLFSTRDAMLQAGETMRRSEWPRPIIDRRPAEVGDRWWCGQGCGFTYKDHQCDQRYSTSRIPAAAVKAIKEEDKSF